MLRRLFVRRKTALRGRSVPTLGLVVLVVCGTAWTGDVTPPTMPNPLRGMALFVDRDDPAAREADAVRSDDPERARLLDRIADRPRAVWFGDWNRDVEGDVRRLVEKAAASRSVPVLVAYNIPVRDCGSHSAGGAGSADAYRAWIDAFAAGLGGSAAVVVVEPDAVAASDCLDEAGRRERLALLDYAVRTLKRSATTRVYVDAGNPAWKPADEMASLLREAGIAAADGFALNVSNTIGTDENLRYGTALSERLGGKHFVVDTSRNGRGAPADGEWCNPPGRALGPAPTVDTGHERADAFLWIKRPGESDGECNGGPSAGEWWASYALDLARRAEELNA